MFKAKLIENENYYRLRSKQLLLTLLPSICIGFFANLFLLPIWLTIIIIALYIFTTFLMFRNQKRIKTIFGKKLIEIDKSEIRINTKKGSNQEIIKLAEVEKIIIKDNYSLAQESMGDLRKEIGGNPKKNYLILLKDNQERKLDFEIDSHFMINKLSHVIEDWRNQGYLIETIK